MKLVCGCGWTIQRRSDLLAHWEYGMRGKWWAIWMWLKMRIEL
jgi:hypothetical protein